MKEKIFAQRLKKIRKRARVTQETLAEKKKSQS